MATRFEWRFDANYTDAAATLGKAYDWLYRRGVVRGVREDADIVMTEALNNIIEHAYGAENKGQIDMSLRLEGASVLIDIYDTGKDFATAPSRATRKVQKPINLASLNLSQLPESGFGWVLIDQLSDKVAFARKDGRNHLHIVVTFRGSLKTALKLAMKNSAFYANAQTKVNQTPSPPTTHR